MPDRRALDARPDHEPPPPDAPFPAPDGGAGGWEAFDDPDAPEPRPVNTPDAPEPQRPTASPAPDGGAGGWEAFDDPDSERPDVPAPPTDRHAPAEVLQPRGELIGEPGASPGIREVPGGEREAVELYGRLSAEGREATPRGYPGRAVELPGGGFVGLRLESKSGGPAIDLNIPGIEITRIHFR